MFILIEIKHGKSYLFYCNIHNFLFLIIQKIFFVLNGVLGTENRIKFKVFLACWNFKNLAFNTWYNFKGFGIFYTEKEKKENVHHRKLNWGKVKPE